MPCNGRTQRSEAVLAEAAPQRIDFGHGNARITAGIASASTSAVARPGFSISANRIALPLASVRSTSCSRVSPVLPRKPASACAGASARGPFSSSATAAVASGNPRAINASRRGVANVSIPLAFSPALAISAANKRAKSADAFSCIRAGISSESSSSRKSVMPATHYAPSTPCTRPW